MVDETHDPPDITLDDFLAQRAKWSNRARQRGAEAAPFHVKHPRDSAHYAELTRTQGEIVLPHVDKALALEANTPPLLALDFGCGWGRWTEILAARYGGAVIGVDLTLELIEYAQAHRTHPMVTYWLTLDRLAVPARSVNLLWTWTVCSAITDDDMLRYVFQDWERVLASDGLVALIDNTSKVGGGAVRSPYSVSRTVAEYQALLPWLELTAAVDFVDLGEINTLMLGRRR